MRKGTFLATVMALMVFLALNSQALSEQEPGSLKWKFEIRPIRPIHSSPAIGGDGTVYVGSSNDNLYAINSDGSLKWKFKTKGNVASSPAIGRAGTVYVGSEGDGNLYAVDPDGSLKWKFKPGGAVSDAPAIGGDGTVYVKSHDGYLYAIDPNGNLKWKVGTGKRTRSSPAIGKDGTVYVGSHDGYLYAVNSDGNLKWKFKTGGKVWSSPAIGEDGIVYVGSYDDYLYAVNPDGSLKWKFKTGNYIRSSPTIGESGTVYIGSTDGYLYAVDSGGNLKWKFKTGAHINTSPAIGEDRTIYVGSDNRYLYAVGPSGNLKWKFKIKEEPYVYSSPAIGEDGTVYIGTPRALYAFYSSSSGLANTPWPMFGHDPRHTGRFTEVEISAVEVSMPKVIASAGDTVTVPINVVNATDVAGGDIVVTYNPDQLTLRGAAVTGVASDFMLTSNEDPSGTVNMALAGTHGITEEKGAIINLEFEVAETAPQGMISPLNFKSCTLRDVDGKSIPSTTQGGAVVIPRVTVSIPDTSALPGTSLTMPINVDNAKGIAGANIDVKYDTDVLTIGDITTTDLTRDFTLTTNTEEEGLAKIGLASASGLPAGSGALVNIGFQVAEDIDFGTVASLDFQRSILKDQKGEEIGSQSVDGSITVRGIKGDVNSSGDINSGDAILALRISVDLLTPTSNQAWAADVNGDDKIDSGDAILILRKAVGLPTPEWSASVAKALGASEGVDVSVSSGTGSPGEKNIAVSISVSDATGIAGGDLTLAYDPDVLTAPEAKGTALAENLFVVSNVPTPGKVKVSLAGATGLPEGSGPLVELIFGVRQDAEVGNTSPLKLTEVSLRNEKAQPISIGTISNSVFRVSTTTPVAESEGADLPESFALLQNYPNPANPSTNITYQLPKKCHVVLKVYAISGQLVKTLVERDEGPGVKTVCWNGYNKLGEKAGSGLYLYRITAGNFTATKKMLLLR